MLQEVFLEFDGRQVHFVTDISRAADFVRESHAPMVVAEAAAPVGMVECLKVSSIGRELDSSGSGGGRAIQSVFDFLKIQILMAFVAHRPDLMWIHAGAVCRGDEALLLVGASGQGKSTLTTALTELGWSFLSDEMAPLVIGTQKVLPYQRVPLVRTHDGIEVPVGEINSLARATYTLLPSQLANAAATARSIIFPSFSLGATAGLHPISLEEAVVTTIACCINLPDHGIRALDNVSQVLRSVPCYRLIYGNGMEAAVTVNEIGPGLFHKVTKSFR